MEANAVFTIPVRGQEMEVTHSVRADKDSARSSYKAKVGGKHLSADTLEALRDKMMNETKRQSVKVEIPFCMIVAERRGYSSSTGEYVVQNGTITGLHAGTGKALVRWADGKTEQLSAYSVLKPLDKATADELTAAKAQEEKLTKRIAALEQANSLPIREAVEAAVTAASGTKPTAQF